MNQHAKLYSWLLVLFCLCSSGCIRAKLTYHLNPDGSGKVVINMVTISTPLFFPRPGSRRPDNLADQPAFELEQKLTAFLANTLERSKGISAWKIDKCTFRDDGKLHLIATAWFDDFSKLHLASGPTVSGKVKRQADGGLLIELHPPKDSPDKRPDKYVALDPNKMTEKQLDDYLLLRRTTFATMRSLMNGLNEALIRIEIILPGKVERAQFAGKVTSENTVTFDITGKTLLEMLDRQMDRTPAQLKAEARKTGRLPAMNSKPEPGSFFGPLGKTPTIVTAPGVKPQFDYAAEVEAAKAATPQWIAKFKLGEIKWPDAKEAVKAP